MSSEIVIRVENLCKSFAIYERPHHRLLHQFFPNAGRAWHRDFHALRDVHFDIYRGETVAIVGRNGSGKSTLLQIICGTLTPTSGRADVRGRVAALLELGAGFNPDFTGRENVYLNGTVLGLTRAEIEQRFDEIAAFADIGEFIDQPVKSYSSGMFVRLAFAVAINVSPDVLVIDEALAVGDEAFQRKCFARLQQMRDHGTTILFVSHSAGAVIELCDRAILLDRGEQLALGSPRFVVSRYHKLLYAPPETADALRASIRQEVQGSEPAQQAARAAAGEADEREGDFDPALVPQSTLRYEPRGAQITDVHILTLSGRPVNVLRCGQKYVYAYRVQFDADAYRVRCGMLIKNIAGLELAGAITANWDDAVESVRAGESLEVRFEFRCLLIPSTYFLNAGVQAQVDGTETYLDRHVDVAMFRVMPEAGRLATAWVDLDVRPELRRIGATSTSGEEVRINR
ncbi:ABC transporter ATP-binding protein [Tahibacter amnicola]|uniref:ABC transporter ATP-binding protein n=1 Tax=Tahibacter amnicola TaxID=2976241 RepID=A0ABY6BHG3_9GAMM|nr:ABC transporter ATP-binding protein [Tahibacter amnicola]UXI69212.1 ABC transporter ATP-binding protein [Tahibacter amnicola]